MTKKLPIGVAPALTSVLGATNFIIARHEDTYVEPTGVNARESDYRRGRRWLEDCLKDPQQLFNESRLHFNAFLALSGWLKEKELVKDGHRLKVEEKLLIFLYICGQGASWRNIRYRCGHSQSKISSIFHEILEALLQLYSKVVLEPSRETPEEIRNNPQRASYFQDCIGALDGSQFKMWVPTKDQRRYRNRHGDLAQNVLAVVDFKLNFLYILAGWEGSAHDGRVLKDAINRGWAPPEGKYVLADAGYSNSPTILTPFRGVRYHLREISQSRLKPQNKEELFNFRHSSLRIAVERTFGVFKRKWRIFDRPHEFSNRTQVKLVYALAAVHNFVNQRYGLSEEVEDYQNTRDTDRNPVKEEEEEDINLISEMGTYRLEMAERMWREYQIASSIVE